MEENKLVLFVVRCVSGRVGGCVGGRAGERVGGRTGGRVGVGDVCVWEGWWVCGWDGLMRCMSGGDVCEWAGGFGCVGGCEYVGDVKEFFFIYIFHFS